MNTITIDGHPYSEIDLRALIADRDEWRREAERLAAAERVSAEAIALLVAENARGATPEALAALEEAIELTAPEYEASEREALDALREQVDRLTKERDEARLRLLSAAGDDLCRLTQDEIKAYSSGAVQIPPRAEFLASCERFHAQIAKESGVLNNCLTLAQMIAENESLRQQLAEAQATCARERGFHDQARHRANENARLLAEATEAREKAEVDWKSWRLATLNEQDANGILRSQRDELKAELAEALLDNRARAAAKWQAMAKKQREALEKLSERFNCGCTTGSFIYGCNSCCIRREVIEPALAQTDPPAALLEALEAAHSEGWSDSANDSREHTSIVSKRAAWLASDARKRAMGGQP